MNLDIERERREFEASAKEHGFTLQRIDGGEGQYCIYETRRAWDMWLAAKRAAVGSTEPVAWRIDWPADHWNSIGAVRWIGADDKGYKDRMAKLGGTAVALYTAPPAPVSAEPCGEAETDFKIFIAGRNSRLIVADSEATTQELMSAFIAGIASGKFRASADAKDSERLDFILANDAFLSRSTADAGVVVYQLLTQDEDEEFIELSGAHAFFPSPRAAIAAAIAAKEKA